MVEATKPAKVRLAKKYNVLFRFKKKNPSTSLSSTKDAKSKICSRESSSSFLPSRSMEVLPDFSILDLLVQL